jgi:hypothetical protein
MVAIGKGLYVEGRGRTGEAAREKVGSGKAKERLGGTAMLCLRMGSPESYSAKALLNKHRQRLGIQDWPLE